MELAAARMTLGVRRWSRLRVIRASAGPGLNRWLCAPSSSSGHIPRISYDAT